MKIKIDNLLLYIFGLSIFSIFIPLTIYPLFFILFIIFYFIVLIKNKLFLFSNRTFKLFVYVIFFNSIALISFILNIDNSDYKQFIKIWINLLFLISVIHFMDRNFCLFVKKNKFFQLIFEIIIFLSFIQILVNVHSINFWSVPFSTGIRNSVEAYRIVEPPIIFGTTEKNIWATKIAFIQIVYFSLLYFGYFKVSKVKLYFMLLISIFNIIYTFSRTAQLVLFLFFSLFIVWKITYVYRNVLLKIFSFLTFILLLIPGTQFLYNKLFHITLGSGDGLAARIELWLALYNHLKEMNLFIGNGILYAKHIISLYTHWTNNNFHNVFLNTFADEGIIGLILYILILKTIFFPKELGIIEKRYILSALFIPFLVCINSQYLGYDNDIAIYLTFIFFMTKYFKFMSRKVSCSQFQ